MSSSMARPESAERWVRFGVMPGSTCFIQTSKRASLSMPPETVALSVTPWVLAWTPPFTSTEAASSHSAASSATASSAFSSSWRSSRPSRASPSSRSSSRIRAPSSSMSSPSSRNSTASSNSSSIPPGSATTVSTASANAKKADVDDTASISISAILQSIRRFIKRTSKSPVCKRPSIRSLYIHNTAFALACPALQLKKPGFARFSQHIIMRPRSACCRRWRRR